MNIKNLNESYEENNKNINTKEIKKIFQLELKQIRNTNRNDNFSKWIEKLEIKLSNQLAKIKNDKNSKFFEEDTTNKLTDLVIDLENFMTDNLRDIKQILENSQFKSDEDKIEEIDSIEELNRTFYKCALHYNEKSFSQLDQLYENRLILKNIQYSTTFYEYYTNKIKELNSELVDQMRENFEIYNYN